MKFYLFVNTVLRPRVAKIWDFTASYPIYGRKVWMPISHNLPLYLKLFKYYSDNVGRISYVVSKKYKNLKIIDVGANIGDTFLTVYKNIKSFKMLCVEGDNLYFKYLVKNLKSFSNAVLVKSFVGKNNSNLNLTYDSISGTGRLSKGTPNKELQLKMLDTLITHHKEFKDSKMLITDTDGFDIDVLLGSKNFLKTSHPILFIEYDVKFLKDRANKPENVFKYLISLGYDKAIFYDNYGYMVCSLNLKDKLLIEELTVYICDKGYYDICIFPEKEKLLFEEIVKSELGFFKKAKVSN